MTITTTTDAALYRLLAWLSPAYPVGAYTYSHALETAVEEARVRDRAGLLAYVRTALLAGAGRVDGALLAAAWRPWPPGPSHASPPLPPAIRAPLRIPWRSARPPVSTACPLCRR